MGVNNPRFLDSKRRKLPETLCDTTVAARLKSFAASDGTPSSAPIALFLSRVHAPHSIPPSPVVGATDVAGDVPMSAIYARVRIQWCNLGRLRSLFAFDHTN